MRGLGFTELVRTTDGEELAARRLERRHPRRDVDHRRPRRGLGTRRQRRRGAHRRPERLPHDGSRRPARPRPGRPALAAVQRRDLVPDGLRPPGGTAARRSSMPRSTASSPAPCATSKSVGARAVVPSAGPPCFLDPDLFHLNVVRGDEPSIFVDQRAFLDRLASPGTAGILAVPGTTIDVDARRADGDASRRRRCGRGDLHRQGPVPQGVPGRLAAVDRRASRRRGRPRRGHRPRRDVARVVGAPAGDGADGARGDRRRLPAAGRRHRRVHRLPGRRGPAATTASRTGTGSRSSARSSRPSSPSAPSTGATRCSCRAASGPGGTASSTSGSTTSSSRCRRSGCGARRPRRSAGCTRPPRSSRTSSSTAGSSSGAAPTATPTWRCSARSRTDVLTCTLHGWRFDLRDRVAA